MFERNKIIKGKFSIENTETKEKYPITYEEIEKDIFLELIDELEYLGYLVKDIEMEG
jgi:DNA-directed RNA polymerase specialized sigma54-like protein